MWVWWPQTGARNCSWAICLVQRPEGISRSYRIKETENDTWMAVLAHLVAERDSTSEVINVLFVMQFGFFFSPSWKDALWNYCALHSSRRNFRHWSLKPRQWLLPKPQGWAWNRAFVSWTEVILINIGTVWCGNWGSWAGEQGGTVMGRWEEVGSLL